MNALLLSAATLAMLVAIIHSALGEYTIFRRMRRGGIVPTNGGGAIGEGHVRIIWASWHIPSAFGIGLAAILLHLAQPGTLQNVGPFIPSAIIVAMLLSSALVFIATKAKHPGWAGLFGVAVLTWLAIA
jgi:hypothetical protein